jgi:hypothetical protein
VEELQVRVGRFRSGYKAFKAMVWPEVSQHSDKPRSKKEKFKKCIYVTKTHSSTEVGG